MNRLSTLRRRLAEITPAHDHPMGLVHPYWARKPHNVVAEIIDCLSAPGERVADPFMGSGTVIFSALAAGRPALGSDLNPLAVFIVNTLLGLRRRGPDHRAEAGRFLAELSELTLGWYRMPGGDGAEYMERERFQVEGTFEQGRFSLARCEVVAKRREGDRWRGRRVVTDGVRGWCWQVDRRHLRRPLDFARVKLMHNSRIAIPRGARLDHYFTRENRAFINAALGLARASGLAPEVRDLRLLLLSSALPLLRLSDKKATSQWPYWRPREQLTSRNPVIVLGQRVQAMIGVLDWLEQALPPDGEAEVLAGAVQEVGARQDLRGRHHLVLTDPPYSDHVPYLEYSALWTGILGLDLPEGALAREIVNTDSPSRREDTADYARRLGEGFDACAALTRPGGHLVWFYQDTELRNWLEIADRAERAGMAVADIIAIPKQRRSMKTVTTPRRTLDGDLICIFHRPAPGEPPAERPVAPDLEQVMARLRRGLARGGAGMSYFEQYALLIREALLSGGIRPLAARHKKVTRALAEATLKG